MQANQFQPWVLHRLLHRLGSGPGFHREPELRVELPGRDVVMRLWIHAGRDTKHHGRTPAVWHYLMQELELVIAVDDDGRARAIRGFHIFAALVVAQEVDAVLRETRPECQLELPRGDDVQAEA